MVIRFTSLQPTVWIPATTDFTATNAGIWTSVSTVSNDYLLTQAAKGANNSDGTAYGSITLNLNTMFGKSGKTKIMFGGIVDSNEATMNATTVASYIRLSDGSTNTNLLACSTVVDVARTGSAKSWGVFTLEKVSTTEITITKINGSTYTYITSGATGSVSASIASTATVAYTMADLKLELYSSAGGGATGSASGQVCNTLATCTFPKFVSRFL